ncbi:RIP metalloprotease RseP [Acidaminobacter sp. JC074]|uniref:RIP metalloprotease RseP n=1 Tax=Acidaminobacter sp. JC074 TaxID=2530199 RepID=UPI001F1130E5|nr:RIP metalloprotease RseP [Acidaminobacter sp. JC074]MCH4888759.1 RIP metalloprotease RseP [Acidaminobacter sp. JC074]
MIEIIRNVVTFIFVIGLLVFIHELGHFVVAKLNGMYVYQFVLGFGPKILKYEGKETTYAISLFPLGGFVDLREDENDTTNERSFASKKPYQRLMVIVAGVIMNFILAYVLIVGIFMTEEIQTNIIGDLPLDMPAYEAGLQVDDEIIEINGEKVKYWNDVLNNIAFSDQSTFDVVVLRDGESLSYTINGVMSDGYMKIGIGSKYVKSPSLAFKYGWNDFLDKSTMIFDGFVKLITRQIDPDQVSGPVGIYQQVSQVAETNNFKNVLYFTALLSINLGIFNLLPFPALDGGRAVFIIYEMVFRKPVAKEKEAFVHFVGMVFLFGLMGVLIVKDLGLF